MDRLWEEGNIGAKASCNCKWISWLLQRAAPKTEGLNDSSKADVVFFFPDSVGFQLKTTQWINTTKVITSKRFACFWITTRSHSSFTLGHKDRSPLLHIQNSKCECVCVGQCVFFGKGWGVVSNYFWHVKIESKNGSVYLLLKKKTHWSRRYLCLISWLPRLKMYSVFQFI